MEIGILIVLGVLLAGGIGAYLWLRAHQPQKAGLLCTRCPRCGQKVRYPANRAGHPTLCPQCGRNWLLPGAPESTQIPDAAERYRVGRR